MDIYKSAINKYANDKKLVFVGRLTGLISLIIAMVIAPKLGSLGQVFQFIQEYTGVVSPGILAVFLMGLFYKKATNNAAIWGVILSVPIAMYFKLHRWSDIPIFIKDIIEIVVFNRTSSSRQRYLNTTINLYKGNSLITSYDNRLGMPIYEKPPIVSSNSSPSS